ncbi:hypothetical protein MARPO_0107s0055 [Marchantia polymorpha]|uniref:Uncharacterized protein n=1 Tax=Marchantia polymorpha TaxID=3197 RepID=A0A2R6WD67_MARPO|nr:hypothetical protein MARPO_0107s0055 [Marchantia polymorpha]|eukprot:PTQ31788.1 hypothetical protein MARPO_0107s0055 [Marchantia polymorpha]
MHQQLLLLLQRQEAGREKERRKREDEDEAKSWAFQGDWIFRISTDWSLLFLTWEGLVHCRFWSFFRLCTFAVWCGKKWQLELNLAFWTPGCL